MPRVNPERFSPRPGSLGNSGWKWGAAIALCFAIRMAVITASPDSFREDPDAYRSLATTWAQTGVYGLMGTDGEAVPTAYRPPLYPWMLSWMVKPDHSLSEWIGIAVAHAVLGTLTCWLTFTIGRRLSLSQTISAIAAGLVLIDPILLRQSTLVMTETLATFLGVLAWWLAISRRPWLHRWRQNRKPENGASPLQEVRPRMAHPHELLGHQIVRSLLLGVTLGLACLCRPTALAWLALWLLGNATGRILFHQRHVVWRWGTVLNGAILVVAFGAILGDWGIRNQNMLGHAVVTTTHGGYTLYLANNPVLYEHLRSSGSREWNEEAFHTRWRAERSVLDGSGEIASDRLANRLAMETIRSEPWVFLRGCAVRLGWFWAMWPSERQAGLGVRWGIFLWYGAVYGCAVSGLVAGFLAWRHGSQDDGAALNRQTRLNRLRFSWFGWAPGIALVISLMMVHSVYWSNMRMRGPAVPVVSLVAACGIASLGRRLQRTKTCETATRDARTR